MSEQLHNMVVLEDGALMSLLQNPQIMQLVPALSELRKVAGLRDQSGRKSCPPCQRNKRPQGTAQTRLDTLSHVKHTLTTLPQDVRDEFKRLLGAKTVRVVYRDYSGGVATRDF